VRLATTYHKGDPAGSYPVYAKAGVYGNYEIYEGTEGSRPYFEGWRFAGVLRVTARDDDGGNGDNGGGNGGGSDTPGGGGPKDGGDVNAGDAAQPALWTALLAASGVSLTALSAKWREYSLRKRKKLRRRRRNFASSDRDRLV
jgi:hypothetical protein